MLVVTSGGLDSTTLLYMCVAEKGPENVEAISFNYGQRHSKELECVKWHCDFLKVQSYIVHLDSLTELIAKATALIEGDIPTITQAAGDPQPATYVPFRNLIMLALSLAVAEAKGHSEVAYGAQKHDLYGYWDTTPAFLERVNSVASLNRKSDIKVVAPLIEFDKRSVLSVALSLNVDVSRTWSCYRGTDLACGVCPTCAERLKAFELCGVQDPIGYEVK